MPRRSAGFMPAGRPAGSVLWYTTPRCYGVSEKHADRPGHFLARRAALPRIAEAGRPPASLVDLRATRRRVPVDSAATLRRLERMTVPTSP
jgi:hypothetical protein